MITLHASTIRATRLFCLLTPLFLAGCSAFGTRIDPDTKDVQSKSFDEAGNRVPTVSTLHSLARVLAARGNDPQCEVVLLRLISDYPRYAPAYNELAELRLRNDHPAEALAAIEEGLRHLPQDRVLLSNRGMLHVLQHDFEAALVAFDAALQTWPDDVRLRSNRALALGMMGREDEALQDYLRVFPPERALHNLDVIVQAREDMEDAAAEQPVLAAPMASTQ